jgi:hypothetical protein
VHSAGPFAPPCRKFTLPAGYWVGASRTSVSAPWQSVDGGTLPQNASHDPYGHWTWLQTNNVSGCCLQAARLSASS